MNPPYLEAFDSTCRRKRIYKLSTDETFRIGRDADSDIVVAEKNFFRDHAKIDYCSESRKWYFTMKGPRDFLVNDVICKSLEPFQLKDGMKITLDVSGRHSYIARLKNSSRKKRNASCRSRELPPVSEYFISSSSSSSDDEQMKNVRSRKKRKVAGGSCKRTSSTARCSEIRKKYNKIKEDNQKLESELKEMKNKHRQHRREKVRLSKLRDQLRQKEERLKMEETQLNLLRVETTAKVTELEDKKSSVRDEIREEVEAVRSVERHELQEEVYESVKQQVMLQFTDIMENELQCSICTDFFINPVLLQCSHTFCRHCIRQWKKKNNVCPVCRSQIMIVVDNVVLSNFVEQALLLFPEDIKQKRMETKALIATQVAEEGEPSTSQSCEDSSRDRFHQIIHNLMNTFTVPQREVNANFLDTDEIWGLTYEDASRDRTGNDNQDDNRSVSTMSSISTVEIQDRFSSSRSSTESSSDTELVSTSDDDTDEYLPEDDD